ncbi:MAG: hypothetical protein HC875_36115 [Anaerolineales bacterium]|nr:hypothetical protein [Anaerolineales bacterium]
MIATLEGLTPIVERVTPWPKLLRRWYYGILGYYVTIGYREGLALSNSSESR